MACHGSLKMPFRFHRLAAMAEFKQVARAHVRLARREDVPHVLTLIQQQAEYHGLREKCVATEANLEAGLFTQQAFHGPTVLFLELSPSSFNFSSAHPLQDPSASLEHPSLEPASPQKSEDLPSLKPPSSEKFEVDLSPKPTFAEKTDEDPLPRTAFTERFAENPFHKAAFAQDPLTSFTSYLRNRHGIAHNIVLCAPIKDPHALAFKSAEGRIIAGFVLFFPKYISFAAKHGFYIEDLYVRDCWRGHGFGSILFKSVARLADELDYCTVEWCVLDSNEKAMKLYEGMGANVHPEWKKCSLTGQNLKTCRC